MGAFFKGSNCSKKCKIRVYDAVVRSKLAYGLESLQINECLKARIDAFHLKGLRQILRITTTYVDRAHSNQFVYDTANEQLNIGAEALASQRQIQRVSDFYELQ